MRSLDGLTLQQQNYASFVAGFGRSDAEYAGRPPGAPPVFQPAALRDRPGSPVTGFVPADVGRVPPAQGRLLGRHVLIRLGLGPAVRGGNPPTATQGFLNATPRTWNIPPAWAIPVSPDGEMRSDSRPTGTF